MNAENKKGPSTGMAYYTVVFERELPEADYHQDYAEGGHDGSNEAAIKQFVAELQDVYDQTGMAGFFQVGGRTVEQDSPATPDYLKAKAQLHAAAPVLLAAIGVELEKCNDKGTRLRLQAALRDRGLLDAAIDAATKGRTSGSPWDDDPDQVWYFDGNAGPEDSQRNGWYVEEWAGPFDTEGEARAVATRGTA